VGEETDVVTPKAGMVCKVLETGEFFGEGKWGRQIASLGLCLGSGDDDDDEAEDAPYGEAYGDDLLGEM